MAKRLWISTLAALWLASACSPSEAKLTEIIVAIDADQSVGETLTRVDVEIYDPAALDGDRPAAPVSSQPFVVNAEKIAPGTVSFPFSVGVQKARSRRFLLVVTGYVGNKAVIEQKAFASFVDNEVRGLGIYFASPCFEQLCEELEASTRLTRTCSADSGKCGGVETRDTTPVRAGAELDAGLVMISAVNAADAGPDAAGDAARDAGSGNGLDAGRDASLNSDRDAAANTGMDSSRDAAMNAAVDAASDSGLDSGLNDAASDAGTPYALSGTLVLEIASDDSAPITTPHKIVLIDSKTGAALVPALTTTTAANNGTWSIANIPGDAVVGVYIVGNGPVDVSSSTYDSVYLNRSASSPKEPLTRIASTGTAGIPAAVAAFTPRPETAALSGGVYVTRGGQRIAAVGCAKVYLDSDPHPSTNSDQRYIAGSGLPTTLATQDQTSRDRGAFLFANVTKGRHTLKATVDDGRTFFATAEVFIGASRAEAMSPYKAIQYRVALDFEGSDPTPASCP